MRQSRGVEAIDCSLRRGFETHVDRAASGNGLFAPKARPTGANHEERRGRFAAGHHDPSLAGPGSVLLENLEAQWPQHMRIKSRTFPEVPHDNANVIEHVLGRSLAIDGQIGFCSKTLTKISEAHPGCLKLHVTEIEYIPPHLRSPLRSA
jgi:hypothetical protein